MVALPEVRQCQDKDSPMFGAVAVRSGVAGIAWSVMTVANGGHHNADENADGIMQWPIVKAPAKGGRRPKQASQDDSMKEKV